MWALLTTWTLQLMGCQQSLAETLGDAICFGSSFPPFRFFLVFHQHFSSNLVCTRSVVLPAIVLFLFLLGSSNVWLGCFKDLPVLTVLHWGYTGMYTRCAPKRKQLNSTRQTNMSRYVVLLWIKWCNHLSCSTLLCNKNRSTNNITGRIPVVITGKSRCKLTSLAVKHAAATTSNILFCYFLALHSYECKARKY